jgi:predicted amidophosphoribosyltransferase
MYCQSCGIAIGQSMRFCNRCGTSVVAHDTAEAKRSEKRLDNYLDGLFWITALELY